MFTPLLNKELEDGKTVTLTIKGFASPLSKSDYNVNLTLRRVSSLINYLSEYEDGLLLPYINGTAENGAKLEFIKVPFGEYQSATISDDLKDKRNSVYSPGAALERKIEIIAIQANDTSQVAMDGSELEKLPLLTFKDSLIHLNVGQTEKQIKEFGDKLEENDKSRLENNIKELREVCESEDMDGVEDLTEKLNSTWQEISTKMYQESEAAQPTEDKADDTTDVEFEEVKE